MDWFRILADLRKVGITNAEVCRRTNIPPSTLQHYKEGRIPRYDDGVAILAVYHAEIPARVTQATATAI